MTTPRTSFSLHHLAIAALFLVAACSTDPTLDSEALGPDAGQADDGDRSDGGDSGDESAGGDIDEAPAEVQLGAELFAANCQVCHGVNAVGSAAYPNLQGRTDIIGQVRSGGGGMPAFSEEQIDDEGVAAIESWLVWLTAPGNGDGDGGGSGGDEEDAHPFAVNCAGCHGPTGGGTDLAPQIRSPNEGYATFVVRNGRDTSSSLGFPQNMPAFGDELADDELDEIFDFLQSQPYPTDGEGLYKRFCGNCHGPTGAGGVVGESPRNRADDRDRFLRQVREGEDGAFSERDGFMPARSSDELSDEQVEQIRAFLREF